MVGGCGMDGCDYEYCEDGCYCLHVLDPDEEERDFYCYCDGVEMIKIISAGGKTVEMTLADYIANHTPKSKLNPQTKVSITCSDLDPSPLAKMLETLLPNKIGVSQGLANKKLNFTLKNTTLGEIVTSSGFALMS